MEFQDKNSILDTSENKIQIINSAREAINKKLK
jgi:hypothetical protein